MNREDIERDIYHRRTTVCKDYVNDKNLSIIDLYTEIYSCGFNTLKYLKDLSEETFLSYLMAVEEGREEDFYNEADRVKDIYDQLIQFFNDMDFSSISRKRRIILNYERTNLRDKVYLKPIKPYKDQCRDLKLESLLTSKYREVIDAFEGLKEEMMKAVEERYTNDRIIKLSEFFSLLEISRLPLGKNVDITFDNDPSSDEVFIYTPL
jgi:hypothetical protein